MKNSPFASSFPEQTLKRTPSLDIASSRKKSFVRSPVFSERMPISPAPFSTPRTLDGIHKDRQTLLLELQERSLIEMLTRFFRKSQLQVRRCKRFLHRLLPTWSPHKLLYGSIVSGIAFGMVSMAFMEHFFGPGVFARSPEPSVASAPINPVESEQSTAVAVTQEYNPDQDVFFEYFGEVTKEKYEESIRDMVKGYPIEAMLPFIFKQDRLTSAFLIGIAKKESNWGKRIPVLDGQDCFNYWGYRGVRRMMGSGGHTCFNSRADAVATVSTRLLKLTQSEKLDTPEKMIVWKCGFSCQGHSRESVKKWISDVDMYFSQLSE